MAQLRQFYMRMMDPTDNWRYEAHWEAKRNSYIRKISDQAGNKGGGANSMRAPGENLDLDAAIKEATKDHSDLTFLSFPENTGREIIIVKEKANKRQGNQ